MSEFIKVAGSVINKNSIVSVSVTSEDSVGVFVKVLHNNGTDTTLFIGDDWGAWERARTIVNDTNEQLLKTNKSEV